MRRAALLSLVALAYGCFAQPYVPAPFDPIPEPSASDVVGVLFLVGDAGAATVESSPLVHRLRADVERWSTAIGRDSSVAVAFLGDNVYPDGVRDRSNPGFPSDSARLYAQVWTLEGGSAREHSSFGLFLAGNHDWGNLAGDAGLERLLNMERQLDRYREMGVQVSLSPRAGSSGPAVIDLGDHARIVTLDTEWWLRTESEDQKAVMLDRLSVAMRGAGQRATIVAAHHPFISAGPHSGVLSTGFDPFWLLRRTGSVVQDLNSKPYRELRAGLSTVFEVNGAPDVFAGGHDHSLQVIEGTSAGDPAWTLVSGAGSKLTGVASMEGLVWATKLPGYMKLLFRRGGGIEIFVEAAPERFLRCEGSGAAAARCIEEGTAAFATRYSARLR